jgi:hypothetical protein
MKRISAVMGMAAALLFAGFQPAMASTDTTAGQAVSTINHSAGTSVFVYSGRGYGYARATLDITLTLSFAKTTAGPWQQLDSHYKSLDGVTEIPLPNYGPVSAICGSGYYRNVVHVESSKGAHDTDTKTEYVPGAPGSASTDTTCAWPI